MNPPIPTPSVLEVEGEVLRRKPVDEISGRGFEVYEWCQVCKEAIPSGGFQHSCGQKRDRRKLARVLMHPDLLVSLLNGKLPVENVLPEDAIVIYYSLDRCFVELVLQSESFQPWEQGALVPVIADLKLKPMPIAELEPPPEGDSEPKTIFYSMSRYQARQLSEVPYDSRED